MLRGSGLLAVQGLRFASWRMALAVDRFWLRLLFEVYGVSFLQLVGLRLYVHSITMRDIYSCSKATLMFRV